MRWKYLTWIFMIMRRDVFTVSSATLILCQLLSSQVHAAVDSKNNVEMVRIPGGVFLMGSTDGPEDERPPHQVDAGEFFIDRTPVTNAQRVHGRLTDKLGTMSN